MKNTNRNKGLISNIQKFSLHDGPGIRTIIFFKGCFAHCPWCCNPESIKENPELGYSKNRCINCGECENICPESAIRLEANQIVIERKKCNVCGICTGKCPANALEIVGKLMTVENIIKIVERDRVFYDNSGGGITISGGEPFYQFDFLMTLLKELKKSRLNIAVETCGFTSWEKFRSALDYIDYVLYDLKIFDNSRHKLITGISNVDIKKNLVNCSRIGIPVIIRVPLIPGHTSDMNNIRDMSEFMKDLKNIHEIHLLPYHVFGSGKYEYIGEKYMLTDLDKITRSELNNIFKIFKSINENTFIKG